ncbi:MAG: NAD-dependent epimerase/dehydratase family protein [Candidatus Thorarchaeota archaeon]
MACEDKLNKKILLLGGFGFIGTNLTEELIKYNEYDIIIFETENVFIQNPDLLKKAQIYYGDFHNEEDYERIFKENRVDMVIHLITTTYPSSSNKNIVFDIKSNLINSINLLNIMVKYNCKNIIFISSGGTIYGIPQRDLKLSKLNNLVHINS